MRAKTLFVELQKAGAVATLREFSSLCGRSRGYASKVISRDGDLTNETIMHLYDGLNKLQKEAEAEFIKGAGDQNEKFQKAQHLYFKLINLKNYIGELQ